LEELRHNRLELSQASTSVTHLARRSYSRYNIYRRRYAYLTIVCVLVELQAMIGYNLAQVDNVEDEEQGTKTDPPSVKLSTTRDTTTSEWSRLFLNECFIASSRLRENIDQR